MAGAKCRARLEIGRSLFQMNLQANGECKVEQRSLGGIGEVVVGSENRQCAGKLTGARDR